MPGVRMPPDRAIVLKRLLTHGQRMEVAETRGSEMLPRAEPQAFSDAPDPKKPSCG